MKPDFGISQKAMDSLLGIFNNYPDITRILVYGSRAKGTFSDRSDLDLVVMDAIDRKSWGSLWMEINSSDFPSTVDIQVWDDIKNENLKEHIQRVGKVFYTAKVDSIPVTL